MWGGKRRFWGIVEGTGKNRRKPECEGGKSYKLLIMLEMIKAGKLS
jgi:hypothetical protein